MIAAASVLPPPAYTPADLSTMTATYLGESTGSERGQKIRALVASLSWANRQLVAVAIFDMAWRFLEARVRVQLASVEPTTAAAVLEGAHRSWKVGGLEVCCVCLGPRTQGTKDIIGRYTCGGRSCTHTWGLVRYPRPDDPTAPPAQAVPINRRPHSAGYFTRATPGKCPWCRHPAHLDGPCTSRHGRGFCKCPPGGPRSAS